MAEEAPPPMEDVVGQPVQLVAGRGKVSEMRQIRALLQKNMKIHNRVNACPCFTCCGPGKSIPCVMLNACMLHFFCPIIFVLAVSFVPWLVVKTTVNNPDSWLKPMYVKGQMVKMFADQSEYQLDWSAFEYGQATMFSEGAGAKMAVPLVHHLFTEEGGQDYSWEKEGCVAFPMSCSCSTLAIVGADGPAQALKDFLTAEYESYVAEFRPPNASDYEGTTFGNKRAAMGRILTQAGQQLAAGRRLKGVAKSAMKAMADAPARIARRLQDGEDNDDGDNNGGSSRGNRRAAREECQDRPAWLSDYCEVDPGHEAPIFRKFGSEEDVDRWINHDHYGMYFSDRSETSELDRLCGAIILENDVRTDSRPAFTLRLNVTDPLDTLDVSGDLTDAEVLLGEKSILYLQWYYRRGFLAIQHLMQKFIGQARGVTNAQLSNDPQFVPLPTPGNEEWAFGELAGGILGNPFTISLMFGPIVSSIAYYISRERQSRQRELMRMMGLSDSALMWSWVVMFVALNFIITFFMTILFVAFLLRRTNFFYMWMALWWFSNSVVTFGMMITAFISSERMAAMCAFGALFCETFAFFAIRQYDPFGKKIAWSLINTSSFFMTMTAVWQWEGLAVGVDTPNLYENIYNYNVGTGIWMLFVDFWLYLGIYYYFDNVATWHGVGVARKPWFCFTGTYWREVMGKPPVIEGLAGVQKAAESKPRSEYMQAEDDERLKHLVEENKCVVIRGLHKAFTDAAGQKVLAVNDLDLTMYQDECYCLLGHNGAGKTTTMMMLTGCMPQSSGSIMVKGCSVPEQLRSIRSDMGFCPQHNVLVDELTCFEHLVLFGMIGGMEYDALVTRGNELLSAVALTDKIKARASSLSGGMKRKLQCALAFLSNPYLVILDEPSSGMDPFARRGMWDTLKQWRNGHILCLTTHYMDEADALGDRIAIMSNGQVACSGTSTFLKQQFGCGYVVSFAKKDQRQSQDSEILHVVRGHVGTSANIMSTVGKELLIQVPFGMADKFPELFREIDQQTAKLGIESYGTSVTNLEEVFLKVARLKEKEKRSNSKTKELDQAIAESLMNAEVKLAERPPMQEQVRHFFIQLYALIIRRFRHGYRNRLSCCAQIGMPVGCLFIFFLIVMLTTVHALPKLVLDTDEWNKAVSSSPRVPLTVSAVDGDAQMDAMLDAWAAMPGVDGVRVSRVAAVPNPDTQAILSYVNSPMAVTALAADPSVAWLGAPADVLQSGYELFGTGIDLERGFVQRMLENQDDYEASQMGGVFYPTVSSWCPAIEDVCTAPGPTIMTNTTAVHAAPILFAMHAGAALADGGTPVTFQITNHPFQKTKQQREREEFIAGVFAAIIIMAAYGFVPSGATSFIVMEKEKDVKHQLVISGCNHVAYWLSNYIFDILWGLLPAAGAWATFAIYGIDSYAKSPGINASVALFVTFLPAMAGFAYMFSFLFSKSGVALFVSWIFNLSFGFIALLLITILRLIESTYDASKVLETIFRFVPVFCLGEGHYWISIRAKDAEQFGYGPLSGMKIGGAVCPPGDLQRPEWECRYMVGDQFLMLLICAFLWIFLTIVIDVVFGMPAVKGMISKVSGGPGLRWCLDNAAKNPIEDEMVLAEKDRVSALDGTKQFVYVNGIHKVYGNRGHAVRGISFAADEGQVFGLLGVNGAGKTTTFKMLCGQIEPTAGEVRIQGYNVKTHASQARKYIGYCPQFDALLESLTTREHLYLYGRIKGLNSAQLSDAVTSQMENLDLAQYINSRAGQLSGGNKRKLSVAMATIGEPPMVFLDEPSAGMDPVARRGMWSVIQTIADKRKKSVVILTTHSMEEAEALCSRIAIQVDGMFRCLGTSQQIKSKYGQGMELNVRFAMPASQDITECCTKLEGTPDKVVDVNWARQQVSRAYGEAVVNELQTRPGSPLVGAVTTRMAVLAEWAILIMRAQAFEKVLAEELQKEMPSGSTESAATLLEKSQNVGRYQLSHLALQGRFKSLGVLFNFFQEKKTELKLEDFQICQTSLEQIFNRFATTQLSQMAQRTTAPAQVTVVSGEGQGYQREVAPEVFVESLSNSGEAAANPATNVQVPGQVIGKPVERE